VKREVVEPGGSRTLDTITIHLQPKSLGKG